MGNLAILPSDIIMDILSRLPAKSVISCKCVCKLWQEIVEAHEFVESHFSKSVPGVVMDVSFSSMSYRFIELRDIQHQNLQLNDFTTLHFPYSSQSNLIVIEGSAEGLLLLHRFEKFRSPYALYVCNPITREFIDVDPHKFRNLNPFLSYGFGKSKISGEYKVVILNHTHLGYLGFAGSEFMVYTVGTGSWRSIESNGMVDCIKRETNAVFLNGNLHWLASDLTRPRYISCFDLETELFTTFSVPEPALSSITIAHLSAFEDCICLCVRKSLDEAVIWLMNEYGNEKSWTVKCTITGSPGLCVNLGVAPVKVLKDGDILFSCDRIFTPINNYYSRNKITQIIGLSGAYSYLARFLHIPSFRSLKSFIMENTISY